MKTFLILALLAMAATMATAIVQYDPSGQFQTQQPFTPPQQQCAQPQPFWQGQQQPFLQQQPGQYDLTSQYPSQQAFPHLQLPFLQQQQHDQFDPIGQFQSQQPFWKLQHPFSKKQESFLQQQPGKFYPSGLYQSQQPFTEIQQPSTHSWKFPQEQHQFLEQQQPFLQQQQQQQRPFFQPFLQQQLNPCRQFLVQQCSPVTVMPFLRSKILQQSSCQVMRQQCCRQLAQIPEQLRCHAIHSVVHAIIVQQQQQLIQPQQQMGQGFFQPQLQQTSQGFIQPQQLAQLEVVRTSALQTLSGICNTQVPLYRSDV